MSFIAKKPHLSGVSNPSKILRMPRKVENPATLSFLQDVKSKLDHPNRP